MELHTFSSLNAAFLDEYKDAMKLADVAVVYFNPHTIAHKKLEAISTDQVKKAFGRDDLIVMNASADVQSFLENQDYKKDVLLLMSSGNFDGIDLNAFGKMLAQ
jgi:UDP-N-acetylmuramate: L-alanyl-gamma-D-glutamyl-meso-diaminopimelate ligase